MEVYAQTVGASENHTEGGVDKGAIKNIITNRNMEAHHSIKFHPSRNLAALF